MSTSMEPTSGADATDTGPTGDEGCAGACVPLPPAGWIGPLALEAPDEGCPSAFPDEFEEFFAGLNAPEPTCSCNCGAPEADCGDLLLLQGPAAACLGPQTNLGDSGDCMVADQLSTCGRGRWADEPASIVCAPVQDEEVPGLTWDVSVLACSGPTGGMGCDGEVCVEEASDLCIAREGEHRCPSDYPELRTFFLGADDDRSCSECSCAPDANVQCGTELRLYGSPGCSGLIAAVDVVGTEPSEDAVNTAGLASANFSNPAVTGSCTPSRVGPTGGAVERDPYSVCCR